MRVRDEDLSRRRTRLEAERARIEKRLRREYHRMAAAWKNSDDPKLEAASSEIKRLDAAYYEVLETMSVIDHSQMRYRVWIDARQELVDAQRKQMHASYLAVISH